MYFRFGGIIYLFCLYICLLSELYFVCKRRELLCELRKLSCKCCLCEIVGINKFTLL